MSANNFLINSYSCFKLFVEQIIKARWTKVFIRLILCRLGQDEFQRVYNTVNMYFRYTVITNLEFCRGTSKNVRKPSLFFTRDLGANDLKLHEVSNSLLNTQDVSTHLMYIAVELSGTST